MSIYVRLTFGQTLPVRVGYRAMEDLTNLEHPWVQRAQDDNRVSYFGLCPECDNPLRLVTAFPAISEIGFWSKSRSTEGRGGDFGLDNCWKRFDILAQKNGLTPHGRHCLKPVPGFNHDHDTILLKRYDFTLRHPASLLAFERSERQRTSDSKLSRKALCSLFKGISADGAQDTISKHVRDDAKYLRTFVVENADLVIGMLAEDIGIVPNLQLLQTMYAAFLDGFFYAWPTANAANCSWLLARTIRPYNLFGQVLRENSETARAILTHVPDTYLGKSNRLLARPDGFITVDFSVRHHVIHGRDVEAPCETVDLVVTARVNDITRNILEKTIQLRGPMFMRRVPNRRNPTSLGQKMITVARTELARHLTEYPEAA